jgi:hypothetical protein
MRISWKSYYQGARQKNTSNIPDNPQGGRVFNPGTTLPPQIQKVVNVLLPDAAVELYNRCGSAMAEKVITGKVFPPSDKRNAPLQRSERMKRFEWILVLLMAASPAWAARKITVGQLEDLLKSMQQAKKTDADVAAELKDVELSEELTANMMNSMAGFVPGQLTTEQLYVLEIRSAVLPPPASDLPATPPPDAATQKAILDKAFDYATKTYAQLPALTATKATRRFQDNAQLNMGSVGSHSTATVAGPTPPIRYTALTETPVTLQNGAEQNPLANDKTHWGDNGMIALLGQVPVLTAVLQDAQAAGKINWLRWESVNGYPFAVYSFAVDKKKTHYAVNYCCFPESSEAADQDLNLRGGVGSPNAASTPSSQPGGNAQGNYKSNTSWKNFKATVPYHGEIFVEAATGIVVRLVIEGDFKSSELVRQEIQRIDYAPETVGGKTMVVPIRSIIDTLELPFGDTERGRLTMRHTLFSATYKNYQPAGN